jgi:AcrR family transcriptional regulator
VKRAGVSHGTFYHYFQSREDILREVAEQADQRLNAPMDRVVLNRSSDAPPAQRIREGVRVFLRAYQEDARIIGVVEEVAHYNDHVRASRNKTWRQSVDKFAASIGELQRRGLADPTLDPVLASAVLASITSRFPEMWLAHEVVDGSFDDAAEQMAKIFINALGIEER